MENKKPAGIRFAPKKNSIFIFFWIFTSLAFPVAIPLLIMEDINITPITPIDMVAIGTLLAFAGYYYFWVWKGTYYELREGQLFYRNGLLTKGNIPVSSIRKIETHTRSWASTNAALSNKGMMITYNKWDEIFIAPKDEDGFLAALLQINPDILIKDHEKPEQLASK